MDKLEWQDLANQLDLKYDEDTNYFSVRKMGTLFY